MNVPREIEGAFLVVKGDKMINKKITKLWGTAFNQSPKQEAIAFAAGRDIKPLPMVDELLVPFELEASESYVIGLVDQKIISKTECQKLLSALNQLGNLNKQGKFKFDPGKEDVHTNIEFWLTQKLGIEVAGKIHSGRSRNEQTIVNMVLYLKAVNEQLKREIKLLIKTLNKASKKYSNTLLPGYTHHQHATVTTLGEILMAFAEEFNKDLQKFEFWNQVEEVSPLGAAAGYGSSYPVSKEKVNQYLKLKQVFKNSIQAITFKGDAEILMVFNLCLMMNHLSSLAQTLIIFSTKEFNFIEINDEYCTGSSIMPQKKNPDTLEVIKAKASMLHGYLMSLLSLTKASFIGYNRDLQWTKYVVMDAINEAFLVPKIIAGIISTLKVNKSVMKSWANEGFILAQSIMENLAIEYQLPMRLAKLIIETTIKKCEKIKTLKLEFLNITIKEFKLNFQVSREQFNLWTNPLYIVKKQLKKEMK